MKLAIMTDEPKPRPGQGASEAAMTDQGLPPDFGFVNCLTLQNAEISASFASGRWLLIVEEEDGLILEAVAREGRSDLELALKIVKSGCEGLLCGPIEREPFLIIADEGGVTRYLAAGLSALEALEKFRRRDLEYIRDHIGGEGHRHQGARNGCSGPRH